MDKELMTLLQPMLEEELKTQKELEKTPLKLMFDKEIEVTLRKGISGRATDKIADLIMASSQYPFQDFIDEVQKEIGHEVTVGEMYEHCKDGKKKYTLDEVRTYYQNNAMFKDRYLSKEQRRINIEILKEIIDTKNLTTEQQADINSEWDSDFWQNQDYTGIKQRAGFFRARNEF